MKNNDKPLPFNSPNVILLWSRIKVVSLGADLIIDGCILETRLKESTSEFKFTSLGKSGKEWIKLCDKIIVDNWSLVTPKFSMEGIFNPDNISSWDGSIGDMRTITTSLKYYFKFWYISLTWCRR